MQAVLGRITRAFSRPNHPAVMMARTMLRSKRPQSRDMAARARYGVWITKARDQRLDLPSLLARVTTDYWMAVSKRDLAALRPFSSARALQIDTDILFEARLLLRWLRRHEARRFAEIVAALAAPSRARLVAAE